MHTIALKPKGLYTLCADGRIAGVDEVDLECCDHTCGLLKLLFPQGTLRGYAGGL